MNIIVNLINGIVGLIKLVFKLIILAIIFAGVSAGIDYVRMTNGEVPIFNISSYDSQKRVQTYNGLAYRASRKIRTSTKEPLTESKNMKYKLLYKFKIDVPQKFRDMELAYSLVTEEVKECTETSKLYYADTEKKVYTYCLNSIKLAGEKNEELSEYIKEDKNIFQDIESKIGYAGLYKDNSTLMFESFNNDEYTNNGIKMYKCNKENINDIYLLPKNMEFQPDFCTYKDDDFKFIFEIEEVEHEPVVDAEGNKIKETLYEDENYIYQFDETKSDYVFITTPEVRGKAATRNKIKDILAYKLLTIDELINKGLQVEKISKQTEPIEQPEPTE